MNDIDKTRKLRATARSLTTKLISKIETTLNEGVEATIPSLKVLLEQLNKKCELLVKYDSEIEVLITKEDELEGEVITAQEYQDKIISCKCLIEDKISSNSSCNESINFKGSHSISPKTNVKLPKLSINKFFGDPSNWLEFWSQFESSIDKNDSLTLINKFSYLKSLTGGLALNAICGLALNEENYKIAIDILKQRFGRTDLTINSHMGKLLNLERVRSSSNVGALRKLYDEIEVNIRSLETLNVVSGSYGHLLYPILLKLLPEDLTLEFSRRQNSKANSKIEFDVSELLDFLKIEIQSREHIYSLSERGTPVSVNQNGNRDRTRRFQNDNYKKGNPPTITYGTHVSYNCVFCGSKEHGSEQCPIGIAQRKINAKKRGLCFKCLRSKHIARNCWRKNTCNICQQSWHNTLLCEKNYENKELKDFQDNTSIENKSNDALSTTISTFSANNLNNNSTVFLQTCTAVISSKFKNILIRILIDGGSHRSFISKGLADKLKLPVIGVEKLQIHAFGEERPNMGEYNCVRVKLLNPRNQNVKATLNALVVNKITGANVVNIPSRWVKKKLKRLSLWYSDNNKMPIDMLIGADSYWEIVTGNIERLSKRLVALDTIFGTTLQDQATLDTKPNPYVGVNKVIIDENKEILSDIKALWELDMLRIKQNENVTNEAENSLIKEFENNIVYKDKRYGTRLLWKMEPENLDSNYEIAIQRLNGLNRRLRQNIWLFEQYEEILNDQLNKNIIEECNFKLTDKNCYFMPHHPVIRNDKSTKVRIVYDASSKGKNKLSLNDCLLNGLNLNPNILDVILKFRENKIAFTADIEKAFLKIGINNVDRDYLRFLFSEDCTIDENLKCFRMTRVGFGVKCSPYILASVIKHHIKKFEEIHFDAFKMLNTALYVDDLCSGADSVEDALRLSTTAVSILKEASMTLRKFETNSEELRESWRENNILLGDEESSNKLAKILGINWDTRTDILSLDIKPLLLALNNVSDTKRCVLSCAAKCFDPVGFLTPFTMRIKCLLQELWVKGLDWDEVFDSELKYKWNEWCSEVKHLTEFSMPRYFFNMNYSIRRDNIELHVFSDASLKAYGAVAYFRYVTENNKTNTAFVMSKTRVAPLKKITLPRLELLGALVAARMGKYLQDTFSVPSVIYWTDSTITLHWIKGLPSRWKQFVCNRVSEIQELTIPQDWRHCDGKSNPADLLTRGCSAKKLLDSENWKSGPSSLVKDKTYWPKNQVEDENIVEEENKRNNDFVLVNTVNADENLNILTKFSSWTKLQRIMAWCLRFKNNSLSKNREVGNLTTKEINFATELIIKAIQAVEFSYEIQCLEKQRPIKCHSKILSLNPFLDEKKILRVGGRLKNAEVSESCKHPTILPKNNHITNLIIQYYHEKYLHGGAQLLLSAIRQNYWIVNAKTEIKKIIWKCIKCCRVRAKTTSQIMADLPASRVVPCRTFSKVGADYAGPFLIKMRSGRGVKPIKCYVCVFVCMATKAVHLELVSDLTSEAFLAALQRFSSRRGTPGEINSDCGTNFVGADKILRKIISTKYNTKLRDWILSENIQWQFNPPGAPHHGGLWEAAVKSMKQHLRKTVGKQLLTYEEFLTLLCRVEACLNSRPITAVSDDPNDISALTPGHFLIGTSLTALPEMDLTDQKITSLKRWQLTQQLYQSLWKRLSKEYLCQLQQRYKWKTQKRDIKVNDLVIIKEDNLPPLHWKLGRVIEVYPGTDGKVRVVKLKTVNGELKRPITKIAILPIENED